MPKYDTTKYTTIRLLKETYDELAKLGTVAESFDDVVKKLLSNNKKGARNQ